MVRRGGRQRADRNLSDLLQELRVAVPGVQVLFAFPLTVPFTERFGRLTSFQEGLYLVTLLSTAMTIALLGRFYRSAMEPLLQRVNTYVRWAGKSTGSWRPTSGFQRWWAGLIDRQHLFHLFAQWRWVRIRLYGVRGAR